MPSLDAQVGIPVFNSRGVANSLPSTPTGAPSPPPNLFSASNQKTKSAHQPRGKGKVCIFLCCEFEKQREQQSIKNPEEGKDHMLFAAAQNTRSHAGELVTVGVIARGGGLSRVALRAVEMSYGSSSVSSGTRMPRGTFEFGRTHVVRPKGRHEATIVWLHGLGDNGSSWSQLLETLPLPNIKWICPTASTRPVALFGGFPCTAWFDVGDLSEEGPDDVEGLDASAAHVANLLSTEPADIKLGVGGFSMGAATALYSATCHAHRKYGNGNPYPVNISSVVGLSGWLPCSRSLKNKLEGSQEAARCAASLPILLCHGRGDEVVVYKHGEKSAEVLTSTGFQNLTFKTYNRLGHYTVPEEMDDVCKWLTASLGLDGSHS